MDVLSNEHTTLAYLAAENGHTSALDALYSLGAKLDVPALDGANPIIIAAENGHHESVKVIIIIFSNTYITCIYISFYMHSFMCV